MFHNADMTNITMAYQFNSLATDRAIVDPKSPNHRNEMANQSARKGKSAFLTIHIIPYSDFLFDFLLNLLSQIRKM